MNVIVLVLDTLRRDKLSVYNDSIGFTDNLQALADQSQVYDQAIAQAPWTLPSHASMFSGEYPWEHGATNRNMEIETGTALLAERFSDAGYRTACYTTNPWISDHTGLARGFDDVDNFFPFIEKLEPLIETAKDVLPLDRLPLIDAIGHRLDKLRDRIGNRDTEEIIETSQSFIQDAIEDEEPFFLFVNLMDVHLHHFPPEEYRQDHAPGVDPDDIADSIKDHNLRDGDIDLDGLHALYDADVDYMDDQIGRLIRFLEDEQLLEDTVIAIASDHGEELGEGEFIGHKFSVSESLVHVPLFIHDPDTDSKRIEDQTELRELYHILPRRAGIAKDEGKTADYALGGYEPPQHKLAELPEDRRERYDRSLRFARTPEKKLITALGEHSDERMIDLGTGDSIPVADSFRERIAATGVTVTGRSIEDTDEKVKKRLEDLGYI